MCGVPGCNHGYDLVGVSKHIIRTCLPTFTPGWFTYLSIMRYKRMIIGQKLPFNISIRAMVTDGNCMPASSRRKGPWQTWLLSTMRLRGGLSSWLTSRTPHGKRETSRPFYRPWKTKEHGSQTAETVGKSHSDGILLNEIILKMCTWPKILLFANISITVHFRLY